MNAFRHLAVLLCLGLCAGSPAWADDLGRLFTTPADRARIDAVRAGRAPAAEPDAPANAVTADRLIVSGILTGSDGKRLVWVNGTRVEEGRDPVLQKDGRIRLGWRDGTRALKPGQGLDLSSGEIFESYARSVEPAPVSTAAQTLTPGAADAAPIASQDPAQDETQSP
jgi:hypothetical protein